MFTFLHSAFFHLPRYFFNEPLYRNSQLTKEPFDDWSAFCKLVLHLDVEDVCHQGHKRVFLWTGENAYTRSKLCFCE